MLKLMRLIVLWVLSALLVFTAGWYIGKVKQQQRDKQNTLTAVEAVLEKSIQQIERANQKSEALFIRRQARAMQDEQHTKELQDALAKTAADRRECYLPDDVMQHIHQARERAARAVTGGTGSAMPHTGGNGG